MSNKPTRKDRVHWLKILMRTLTEPVDDKPLAEIESAWQVVADEITSLKGEKV
jgi:ABC-type uncharacterized transport system involved in gliding motility auxiliary subunit